MVILLKSVAAEDSGATEKSVAELHNQLLSLQQDFSTVTETAAKLMEEREERQAHMDVRNLLPLVL